MPSGPAFRAKGLVFQGALEFYAETVPGGRDAVNALLPPALKEFFTQPFLTGGWYDVLPILPVAAAAARAANKPLSRLVRENAAWLAKRDLRGVYRLIVSMASVEMVVTRLPDLSLRYFDFGRAAGTMTGPKRFEAQRAGIPAPLADWFSYATSGFAPVALEMVGAKNVSVRSHPHVADGQLDGVELTSTRFEIAWE
jgi:hypothetical protein